MAYVAVKPSYDADVIIAGAGPAGAAAACHLARSGASVTLLDRMTFPRDKVCGDFVGPSALVELDSIGVAQLAGYARTNIARRAALYIDGEELISRPFPEIEGMPSHGRVIPRLALDQFIVDAARGAGARMMDGYKLTGFAAGRDETTGARPPFDHPVTADRAARVHPEYPHTPPPPTRARRNYAAEKCAISSSLISKFAATPCTSS